MIKLSILSYCAFYIIHSVSFLSLLLLMHYLVPSVWCPNIGSLQLNFEQKKWYVAHVPCTFILQLCLSGGQNARKYPLKWLLSCGFWVLYILVSVLPHAKRPVHNSSSLSFQMQMQKETKKAKSDFATHPVVVEFHNLLALMTHKNPIFPMFIVKTPCTQGFSKA